MLQKAHRSQIFETEATRHLRNREAQTAGEPRMKTSIPAGSAEEIMSATRQLAFPGISTWIQLLHLWHTKPL